MKRQTAKKTEINNKHIKIMTMDFITSAMPWIAAGLTVAIAASLMGGKPFGKTERGYLSVSVMWFAVALMEWFVSNNTGSAVSYMSLGFMFIALAAANQRKKGKEDKGDKEE